MSDRSETRNMALFCDFENVALGVRDAKYEAFELIEIPHVPDEKSGGCIIKSLAR